MANTEDRFAFIAEWYDYAASMLKKYILFYFLKDNAVEMFEKSKNRLFLKRTIIDHLKPDDFFLNNVLTIMNRRVTLVDFADNYTKSQLEKREERTFALIKRDGLIKMGQMLDEIHRACLYICRLKKLTLTQVEACELYIKHRNKGYFETLVRYLIEGPVIVLELRGENAIDNLINLIGPGNPLEAQKSAPNSIRAKYGTDHLKNAIHCANSPPAVARESEIFFPSTGPGLPNTATYENCTCAIIKPHAIQAGIHGLIISNIIDEGFEISAIQMFFFDQLSAEEFFQVYKGVVAEYQQMVNQLTSGFCIAMEICSDKSNTPKAFRELVGPSDPEIARILRPNTLRAKFGQDKILNALHCTDLPEDGMLEVEYFFKILDLN